MMTRALRGLLVALLLPGLVLASLPVGSSRWLTAVWNFGHVALFFLLVQTVLAWRAERANITGVFVLRLLLGAVLLGGAIEGLQWLIGRDCELADVIADAVGAGAGVLFSRRWTHAVQQPAAQVSRYAVGALLLVYGARDVLLHSADAILRWQSFPLLYTADSPLATWARLDLLNVKVEPVHEPAIVDHALLQVDLQPGRYSTLSVDELNSDWRGHDSLVWRWYNPDAPLALGCRAHDQQHVRNGYVDADRYNGHFVLASGWTEWVIPLEQLRHAPAQREMDLAHMRSFGCFASDLTQPRRLYLDKILLRREKLL